ncbi:hypothetical protein G9P44_005562 [Scheffersomyces stipitis]|nr:hypothetical protein G9P44_005562 [Scheffersomyces stipitis]
MAEMKENAIKEAEAGSLRSTSDESSDAVAIPDEIYNWRMVVVALTAAFAAVIIGYDAGFVGGTVALESFQDEFNMPSMTAKERSNISANVVSVFQAGAFWGAIFFYPIGELLGRKIGLCLSGFFLTFGAAISLYSKSSTGLGAIYAGRVLTGIGIGGCSGLAPIYISESSPALIRGKLVGMWEMSWQVGGVVGYWINYGVLQNIPDSRKQWLIPFAIQLVPSGMFWAGSFLIPESPRYLVHRGQMEQARKNLSFLRNLPVDHPYSIHEMENIVKDINDKKAKLGSDGFFAPFKKVLSSKKILYRLLLTTSLFPMQNGSGINAITYYSPTVFKSFGIDATKAGLQSTGVFGLLKAFASLVWLFLVVDRFGRKTALVWGSVPCSLCMWYIGAYVKIANPSQRVANGNTTQDAGGKAAQAMLYIWTLFYGASWNGTPWVFNSEVFSQEVRTLTQAINASANWFWAFVMGRWSGQALDAIGYKFYFIFATCMIVFPVVILLLYPETKEVPLEAIDYLFEVPAWRARKHAMEQYRIEYENGAKVNEMFAIDSDSSEKERGRSREESNE